MNKCKPFKWTDEELAKAVKNSYSIAGTLRELNLKVAGANYRKVPSRIRELKLDTSHWTGQGHLRGKTHTRKS